MYGTMAQSYPEVCRFSSRNSSRLGNFASNIHINEDFDITEPQLIEDGENVAILFHGSIGLEVLKARGLLAGDGVFPRLISIPLVMPVNIEKLLSLLKGVKCVVTVEEHFLNSGFGSTLSREYVKIRPDWKLFTLGITDGFIHVIKDSDAMREHFGISASRIAEFIRKMDVYLHHPQNLWVSTGTGKLPSV